MEYPDNTGLEGPYPNIENCGNIVGASWIDISDCKFNLFNKLGFPFEAARYAYFLLIIIGNGFCCLQLQP